MFVTIFQIINVFNVLLLIICFIVWSRRLSNVRTVMDLFFKEMRDLDKRFSLLENKTLPKSENIINLTKKPKNGKGIEK